MIGGNHLGDGFSSHIRLQILDVSRYEHAFCGQPAFIVNRSRGKGGDGLIHGLVAVDHAFHLRDRQQTVDLVR